MGQRPLATERDTVKRCCLLILRSATGMHACRTTRAVSIRRGRGLECMRFAHFGACIRADLNMQIFALLQSCSA